MELGYIRWLAKVNLQNGGNVLVHINRASPIDAKGAMKAARSAAAFGKVTSVMPVGQAFEIQGNDD